MLRCNLNVLLSERNVKITRVSRDTGISRTTLTALCYNHGQGIQFDTLNTLCCYLSVTPEQIFTFVPFNVELKAEFENGLSNDDVVDFFDVDICVMDKNKLREFRLLSSIGKKVDRNNFIESIELWLDVESSASEQEAIAKYFVQIPLTFKSDFERTITNQVLEQAQSANEHHLYRLGYEFATEESYSLDIEDISLHWPDYIKFKKVGD